MFVIIFKFITKLNRGIIFFNYFYVSAILLICKQNYNLSTILCRYTLRILFVIRIMRERDRERDEPVFFLFLFWKDVNFFSHVTKFSLHVILTCEKLWHPRHSVEYMCTGKLIRSPSETFSWIVITLLAAQGILFVVIWHDLIQTLGNHCMGSKTKNISKCSRNSFRKIQCM